MRVDADDSWTAPVGLELFGGDALSEVLDAHYL